MFLFIRADVCRQLPSDSASPRTPLPLAVAFPLSGRLGDLHPLEHAHAGRTKETAVVSLHRLLGEKAIMNDLNAFAKQLKIRLREFWFNRTNLAFLINLP